MAPGTIRPTSHLSSANRGGRRRPTRTSPCRRSSEDRRPWRRVRGTTGSRIAVGVGADDLAAAPSISARDLRPQEGEALLDVARIAHLPAVGRGDDRAADRQAEQAAQVIEPRHCLVRRHSPSCRRRSGSSGNTCPPGPARAAPARPDVWRSRSPATQLRVRSCHRGDSLKRGAILLLRHRQFTQFVRQLLVGRVEIRVLDARVVRIGVVVRLQECEQLSSSSLAEDGAAVGPVSPPSFARRSAQGEGLHQVAGRADCRGYRGRRWPSSGSRSARCCPTFAQINRRFSD